MYGGGVCLRVGGREFKEASGRAGKAKSACGGGVRNLVEAAGGKTLIFRGSDNGEEGWGAERAGRGERGETGNKKEAGVVERRRHKSSLC